MPRNIEAQPDDLIRGALGLIEHHYHTAEDIPLILAQLLCAFVKLAQGADYSLSQAQRALKTAWDH